MKNYKLKLALFLAALFAAFALQVNAQDSREDAIEKLRQEREAIIAEMSWKEKMQTFNTEIDMMMSMRAFTVGSDIATVNKYGDFLKTGGAIGAAYGNGQWTIGARFAMFQHAIKERITTNMHAVSLGVNRKIFLDNLIHLPVYLYAGMGVDYKVTRFEGTYYRQFSEEAIKQIDLINGGFEPKLGTVHQITPYVKLGAEYVFRNFENPFGVFLEVDNHFSGASRSQYVAFQNTNVTKDLHIAFGFRIRKF